jgi:two-component system NtrC family response regulator
MKDVEILVIDQDQEFLSGVQKAAEEMGHRMSTARTLADGIKIAAENKPDVVIVNSKIAEVRSINVLSNLLEAPSFPEVIVISDSADADEAELAIRSGAWDYIEKPKTAKAMSLPVLRALEYRAKKPFKDQRTGIRREIFQSIAGVSTRMKACLDTVALASESDASVLISGETGTGKELFALAVHNNSARCGNQFVVVDCASLPPTLVESILFGYEKGAFTGADKPHKGLIKRADGGTLFLDEVGELPLSVQKSFLRVLQERKFRPVGGEQEIRSNFRLISATNRNLEDMAEHRTVWKDLLFRLKAFSIELPLLRERPEDIPDIAWKHLKRLCQTYKTAEKDFSSDFFATLARYDWPGNVRELVNALERAVSAAREEPIVFPKHLPTYIRIQVARSTAREECDAKVGHHRQSTPGLPSIKEARDAAISKAEQIYLRDLIAFVGTDIGEARRVSGLSRSRLYGLLNKYGIKICPPPETIPEASD